MAESTDNVIVVYPTPGVENRVALDLCIRLNHSPSKDYRSRLHMCPWRNGRRRVNNRSPGNAPIELLGKVPATSVRADGDQYLHTRLKLQLFGGSQMRKVEDSVVRIIVCRPKNRPPSGPAGIYHDLRVGPSSDHYYFQ